MFLHTRIHSIQFHVNGVVTASSHANRNKSRDCDIYVTCVDVRCFSQTIWELDLNWSCANPWEYIHSGRVTLPAVLPKVHHRPEPLYVPTEVYTLQVDRLDRLPGFTQAPYRRILHHRIASWDPPRLISLCTDTQGSLVPQVPTLKEVRVRESFEGGGGNP